MKLCFISSSGGHFEQLMMLKPLMQKYDSFIVTEKTGFACKSCTKTYYLTQINRKEVLFIFKFIYIFLKSFIIFIIQKPDIIISTGALASFPMCLISKLFGSKVVFIESFSKINSQTITGKLVYKFCDLFIIQWESLKKYYPESVFGGGIY